MTVVESILDLLHVTHGAATMPSFWNQSAAPKLSTGRFLRNLTMLISRAMFDAVKMIRNSISGGRDIVKVSFYQPSGDGTGVN